MNAFSREALLAKIKPDMRLTKDFLKNVYSYELDYPGFSEQAIAALEAAGCSRARQYYEAWVSEYEAKRDAGLKEVAHWYRLELERQWGNKEKEGESKRKQEEIKQASKKWMEGLF